MGEAMTWTFESGSGKFYDPQGEHIATGYAGGNCGKNPEGINNPEMQAVKGIGPLPEGVYTLGEPVEHSQLGAFAIPLKPDPSNDMMGRGGFYFHGDSKEYECGSEGCIVMAPSIRHQVWESDDHTITVVAVK